MLNGNRIFALAIRTAGHEQTVVQSPNASVINEIEASLHTALIAQKNR
jgi:hypothetical protein